MLLVILLLTCLLFYGVGIGVTKSNASSLLSGYNTLSAEKKENFDLEGYLKSHKSFFTFLSLSTAALSIISYFIDSSYTVSLVVIYILAAFLYFLKKTQQYNRNKVNWSNYFTAFVIIGAIGLVIWLTFQGFKNDEITITQNKLSISGMYDKQIDLSSIDSVAIVNQLPNFPLKINGLGMGDIRKGYFKNASGEKAFLSVTKSNFPDYLYIKTSNRELLYLNNQEKSVQTIYSELQVALQNQ